MNSFVLFQSSLIPLLLITSFLSINFQFSVCADDAYANCSQPITCRGVKSNIFYPFWGANRAEYCGKSGFEVTCQGDVPMISMQKINFTILDSTTTPTPTVKVARQDYNGTLCPNSSLNSLVNTSLNFSLFDYTHWTKNVSFYYGCTSTATAALSKLGYNLSGISLECNSEVNVTFLTETQTAKLPDASALDSCRAAVLVPVSAGAADALDNNQTSTIWNAVNGGFELNVQNDDTGLCNNCVDSGGSCGQDTTNAQFICYCSNLTSTGTCTSGSSSDVQQLLLFYACPPLNIPLPPQLTSQFNCTLNSTTDAINYYVTEDLTDFGISNISSTFGTCTTAVTVRLSPSAASNLAVNSSKENLGAALDSGYGLKWDASNNLCERCQGSGGRCGYNTIFT